MFSQSQKNGRTLASLILTTALALPAATIAHNGGPVAAPDSHAPIGVMGDHTHNAGEFMVSYRYMFMDMDGNRDGTSGVSESQYFSGPVGEQFAVMPTEMTMHMHMIGLMWAPTDQLTLAAMLNYVEMEMEHTINPAIPGVGGTQFTTDSSGIGDTPISALFKVASWETGQIHLNFGVSLPTGSIDERHFIPLMGGVTPVMPYSMQLGSGTVDLLPGATYLWRSDAWSGGAQARAVLRTGENDADYSLGDRFHATTWLARRWMPAVSTSVRLEWQSWGAIKGADSRIGQAAGSRFSVPTAQPDLRGGERLDLSVGVNFIGQQGFLRNHRLALELGAPVYQNLDGPQLETDFTATVGWQLAW